MMSRATCLLSRPPSSTPSAALRGPRARGHLGPSRARQCRVAPAAGYGSPWSGSDTRGKFDAKTEHKSVTTRFSRMYSNKLSIRKMEILMINHMTGSPISQLRKMCI